MLWMAVVVLAMASLMASGILFRHARVSTYLAAAGALFQAQWLLLSLLDRTVLSAVQSGPVFLAGAALVFISWLSGVRRWHGAGWRMGWWRRELAVAVVLAPVVLSLWFVLRANGWSEDGTLRLRGFYNGDTVTLAALTEQARLVPGLVTENPFAAGAALEYPTVLHGALASLLAAVGYKGLVFGVLPALSVVQVLIIVPLFFLLWDEWWPQPAWQLWAGVPSRWLVHGLQAGLTLYVLSGVWDSYIFPQSHFFLTAIFLLLLSLLGLTRQRWRWLAALPVALVLVIANAVTGAAAALVVAAYLAVRAASHGAGRRVRLLLAGGSLLAVLAIPLLSPGEAPLGWPRFSYSAAGSFFHVLPVRIALVAGVYLYGGRFRFLSAAVGGLLFFSVFLYLFSARAIVAENATRLADHAAVAGLPLLLPVSVQLLYWLRAKLRYENVFLDQGIARWATVLAVGGMVLFAGGSGVARALDTLWRREARHIPVDMQAVLLFIRTAAPANAAVLADPHEPFAVPLLTGRSLVRTADFWLSPQDGLLTTVEAAFAGDGQAQAAAAAAADFLVLTDGQAAAWDISTYEFVAEAGTVSLYRTR